MKRKSQRMKAFMLVVCMLVSILGGVLTKPRTVYAADDYPAGYKNLAKDACSDEWNFYNRECVSFVAWCLNSRNGVAFHNYYGGVQWGNAKNWGNAARQCGITVDMNPAKGSVWWSSSGDYGHVAWVSSVDGNNVHIEEYNYGNNGNYHERTVAANSASGYIHIKDIPLTLPTVSEVWIEGENSEGYMIGCKVSGEAVSSVAVTTWINGGGQTDQTWKDMEPFGNGVYKYFVHYSDHYNDSSSTYYNVIFAYNSAGQHGGSNQIMFTPVKKPEVSDIHIESANSEGYMIECKVSGEAVSGVSVTTWINGGGQTDQTWKEMESFGNGVYKYFVRYSDHYNDSSSKYYNVIFAYNPAGHGSNELMFAPINKPEISDIHIADADSDGYTIECKIDSYNMLSAAQVATWTTINGKDDLQWKNLERQPDGLTYKSYIPYSSHNNEKGSYENLIYAKSITGEESQKITHCNELHNWDAGRVLKEAKCDETGLKEYTCTACNATKREEIPAAHNEDSGTVTKQPTETETGIRTYKCSICQRELRTEEIAKLPPSHTHDYEASAWRSDAETHWKECECGERSENAAHQFSWVIDIAATEDSTGLKHEECETCGYGRSMGTIIEQLNAADNIALSKTSCTYNGKTQKPSVTVKDSSGKTLKNNVDYTVSFPKGMKNVGRYIITVTLKGNYSGTISETFDIVPKGTSISKVTAKKKGFTVKWKKQKKQTTGYEIAYSTSSKFAKKSTKITDAGKSRAASKTVSNLKAKKKYYVRIRTYKTVKISGKSVKLYSDWSKAKAVTTKK